MATLPMALLVALLLVLGGAWIAARAARRTGFVSGVAGFLLLFLAAWSPVADRLLEPLEQAYQPVLEVSALEDIAAVVVLGVGWEPEADWPAGTRLSDSSVQRLMEGLRLLEALPDATLVLSGGSRRVGEAPVAQGHAAAAQALGVLDTPVDTAQEAYAVRAVLADGERFFPVTSASHMRRAVRHFERVELESIAAPTEFKTGSERVRTLGYWLSSGAGADPDRVPCPRANARRRALTDGWLGAASGTRTPQSMRA